jgi:hypothetical protein
LNTALQYVKKDIKDLKHERHEFLKNTLSEFKSFSSELEKVLDGFDASGSVSEDLA